MAINDPRLPIVSQGLALERLEAGEALAKQWLANAAAEKARRASLSPAKALAEQMNFAFSREPGEAWFYEGDNWSKPEHKRWLRKAEIVMEKFDDPAEALRFLRSTR